MAKHPYTHKPRHRLQGSRTGPRRLDFAPDPGRTPDAYVGRCDTCDAPRYRSQVREVEVWECCEYACQACGSIVNQSVLPF